MTARADFTLFDVEPVDSQQEPVTRGFAESDEHCYRVTVAGAQVGSGGCGVTLWFDSEQEAIVGAEAAMGAWPGQKVATVEMRTVRIVGPRKGDRVYVGLTPVRTVGCNQSILVEVCA